MSYDTIEDKIATIVKRLDDYSDQNVSQGDYSVLGNGITKAVILMPGAISSREVLATNRRVSTLWELEIQIFTIFDQTIKRTSDNIKDARQEILDQFDRYVTLDGEPGVVYAFISRGGEPETWIGEGNSFWMQSLYIDVRENANFNTGE